MAEQDLQLNVDTGAADVRAMGPALVSRARVLVWWLGAAFGIAVVVLVATLLAAMVLPAAEGPVAADPPFAIGDLRDVVGIFARNVVVLGLVTALSAVLVRGAAPSPGRFRLLVVVGAVLLAAQVYRQASALSWISAYLSVPPATLLGAILPHSLIELAAIVLPLTAAAIRIRSPRLGGRRLPTPLAALALAIPLLATTAVIETFVSPRVYQATACSTAESEIAAHGGCKPCPEWAEATFHNALALQQPVPEEAAQLFAAGCKWSNNTVPSGYEQPAPNAPAPTAAPTEE